jgi:WD40 repeat protein
LNYLAGLNNSLLSNELRTINVGGAVQALSYSPDGKIVAVGSTSGTVLLDAESGEHLTKLRSGNTWALMYSPDGMNIATANVKFGHVEVWGANILDKVFSGENYYECELKKRLKIKEGAVFVYGLAYSPDGKHIAVAAGDHNVYIFNIENSDKPKVLEGHAEAVTALAFSPDSKKLASGSADKTLRLWDVYSGKTISILSGHSGSILSLTYSSNGKSIVSGSDDKTVRLWDVDKAEATQILLGHSQRIWAVAYSLNEKVIASGSDDRTVLLWNANNGELIATLKGHAGSVQTVVFLSCGKIVSGSLDGKLIEWKDEYSDEDDFTYVAEKSLIDKQGHVLALTCHPNGKMIASGSEDKILRLWSLQGGSVEKYLKGHLGGIRKVVYSQNGKIVASISDGNEIKLWSADSGEIIRTLSDHEEPVVSIAYSPDGRFFSSSDRMLIKLRDTENYSVIRQVRTSNIVSFIFDSDGESLIILVGDFHRDSKGFLNHMFANMLIDDKDYYSWKAGVAYYSKNKILAFGGVENSNVEIWDIYGEKKFDLYSSSPKFGRSNDPSSIRLLDVVNKKIIATLSGHHGKILDLAFSSNGKLLASASADKTVRLWHVKTGSLLNIFNDHADTVLALAFSSSPSGEVLLSAGKDGVIKVRPISDIYQLLCHFESKDVSAILKFLWKMNLFDLEFKDELTPLQLDEKYQSLSEPPYPNETKLDQVVRLLEEQNAYRTTPLISPPVSDER